MADSFRYQHVIRAALGEIWALMPTKLEAIAELLALRVAGGRVSDEDIAAVVAASQRQTSTDSTGGVAVLPIVGVLSTRVGPIAASSGMSGVEQLMSAFDDLVRASDVSAIVLDVDSPGGSVSLIPEFAAKIRAARSIKPVVGVVDTLAASAGYYLIAQCNEVVASPSSELGSIGCYAMHQDLSKAYDALGVTNTLIQGGQNKTEWNPYEPLSPEGRASMQAVVDDAYRQFVADVAVGRGVTRAQVVGDFGDGRLFAAAEGISRGLADRMGTLEETVRRLQTPQGRAAVMRTRGSALVAPRALAADELEDEPAPAQAPPAEDDAPVDEAEPIEMDVDAVAEAFARQLKEA